MDKLVISGGTALGGRVTISGAKNSALKLMAASLLSAAPITLQNVPDLTDIATMGKLLQQHGVTLTRDKASGTMTLNASSITSTTAPYEIVRQMRASINVLGPLLARFGQARVSLPGGCAIGTRPVDMHIQALEELGAIIVLDDGYIVATAPQGLRGREIRLRFPSVGATENTLMAATLAHGTTVIDNAAREPEIGDLAALLNSMGARISGMGSSTLTITGVTALQGTSHRVISDRIEAGTFAVAAAITRGDVELVGARLQDWALFADALRDCGVSCTTTPEGVRVSANGQTLTGVDITTAPFPGFATDLQAQMMALLCTVDGSSRLTETIFENRFMHVPELTRMGADIDVSHAVATVRGVARLRGAPVMATDLRASVSLVLAGLAAEGTTTVNRIYHLDRGYENIESKLSGLGASVKRISG